MPEERVTIELDANIEKLKRNLAEATESVRNFGKQVHTETDSANQDLNDIGKGANTANADLQDTGQQAQATGKKLDGMGASIDVAGGKFGNLRQQMSIFASVAPGISGISGAIGDMGEQWKKAGKAGKIAMAGVGLAIGGIIAKMAIDLAKAIFNMMGQLAKASDPVRYEKNMNKMRNSISKMKSALGSLMGSTIFQWITDAISKLADKITEGVENIQRFIAYLQGFLGVTRKVNQSLEQTAEDVEDSIATATEGLAGFDKLNTLGDLDVAGIEESERLEEIMADAYASGQALNQEISKAFGSVLQMFSTIANFDLGGVWDDFTESAGNAWDSVKSASASTWESITETGGNVWNGIKETSAGVWDSIASAGKNVWESMKSVVSDVWSGFTDIGTKAWNTISSFATSIWDGLKDMMSRVFSGIFDIISKQVDALVDTIKWIIEKVEDITGAVSKATKSVTKTGGNVLGSIGGGIKGAGESIYNFFTGHAVGGEFKPNDPHLIVVGDNKRENEVLSPISTIEQAVRNVLGQSYSNQPIEIAVQLDGRTLARASYDYLETERRRRGTVI